MQYDIDRGSVLGASRRTCISLFTNHIITHILHEPSPASCTHVNSAPEIDRNGDDVQYCIRTVREEGSYMKVEGLGRQSGRL